MYSSWMPQNVQKRLLLYVLQQLALFSAIDLPNLEQVSLNNIHLRDVSIDPERLGNLLGFRLQRGKMRDLELTGSLVDGVTLRVCGVDAVVTPAMCSSQPNPKNAFLLAQSTAGLAKTVINSQSDLAGVPSSAGPEETPAVSAEQSIPSPGADPGKKTSPLGGVVSRAVDLALLRLHVCIKGVNITVVVEPVNLQLLVAEISFAFVSGTRKIAIRGVRLAVVKPKVHPGNKAATRLAPDTTESATAPAETDGAENDSSDNGSDTADDLTNSMVFTHEEASLIYMSATSHAFMAPKKPAQESSTRQSAVILYVDRAEVSFEGAMPPADLKISVNSVNVAAAPALPTVTLVCNTIVKLLRRKTHGRMEQKAAGVRRADVSADDILADTDVKTGDSANNALLLNKISVREIAVGFTSALNTDGTFASYDDDMTLFFSNCTVKQKADAVIYGGVEAIELLTYRGGDSESVFRFKNDEKQSELGSPQTAPPKADFRFEVQLLTATSSPDSVEATVLLSKAGTLCLDAASLLKIVSLATVLGGALESVAALADIAAKQTRVEPPIGATQTRQMRHVVLQTSSFRGTLNLLESASVDAVVFPVSFDSTLSELDMRKIEFSCTIDGATQPLLHLAHLRLLLRAQDFATYDFDPTTVSPKLVSCACPAHLLVRAISGSLPAATLAALIKHLTLLARRVDACYTTHLYRVCETADRSLLSASKSGYVSAYSSAMYFPASQARRAAVPPSPLLLGRDKPRTASLRVRVELVVLTVQNVFPQFGDMRLEVRNFSVVFQQAVLVVVDCILVDRVFAQGVELFVKPSGRSKHPLFFARYRGNGARRSLGVDFRQFYVEYYAKWLNLFENEVSHGNDAEELASAAHSAADAPHNVDVEVNLADFALGLTPLELPSTIYIGVAKGWADFTARNTQCHVKSSFKNVLLFLVDDVAAAVAAAAVDPADAAIQQRLVSLGFAEIGKAATAHVSATITADPRAASWRNKETPAGELALVDAKVSSDDLTLTLCADSAHTLVQTLSNLKEPVVLREDEKFRLKPCGGFALPAEIYYDDFGLNSDDKVVIAQLHIADSANSSQKALLNIVDGHFAERLRPRGVAVVPFKLHVSVSRAQVCLFNGYDWKATRKAIRKAVHAVEKRAEKTARIHVRPGLPVAADLSLSAEPSPIEDVLYQSIHISLDPAEDYDSLARNINVQLQSHADAPRVSSAEQKNLRLSRSQTHMIAVEIRGAELAVSSYTNRDPRREPPPPGVDVELVNRFEAHVDTFTVFDAVPTSSWSKFAGYMAAAGEREVGTHMLRMEMVNIRPEAALAFPEAMVRVKLLPLRMYIDQDTFDFAARFFAFRDPRFALVADEIVYFQKLVLEPFAVKFDYKPKRMDLAGLRSGKHAEWVNLFILNGSSLALERAVVYGAHGFADLGTKLARVYGPYIQKCQLTSILAGIGRVRSIVNVGRGVKDFVAIPLKEYYNDGRLSYGLQQGTMAFAKTASYELLRLGVNLASGLQVALETLEEYFGGEGDSAQTRRRDKKMRRSKPADARKVSLMESSQTLQATSLAHCHAAGRQRKYSMTAIDEDDDLDDYLQQSVLFLDRSGRFSLLEAAGDDEPSDDATDTKRVSHYSNQPRSATDGLRSAYTALGKSLGTARNRWKDMRQELRDTDSVQELLKLIAKSSPVLVIRPMIGTTEAMMKTLMGISNEIDSRQMRESYDKYGSETP
ncbi:hypothetical protein METBISCDRAFT_12698 [Metschnikowia bicuspidata]|uniref:Autophagy-related protein 2 n=1 Tax=Metschnikowia bicuspidata TaxID=27322 RepID=A0A4P9ZHV6_9ASCO|nr:hypothetical protein METBISCDRAFT_12698 [Metschnikowia bicuspidata]